MSKMNTKDRSKLANDTKREYIKAAKVKNVVRKLNNKAKTSNLNKIKKKKDEEHEEEQTEIDTSDVSTDSSDSEQFVIRFSSDSEAEGNKKRYDRKKTKKEKLNNMQKHVPNKDVLELQKEIEMLRLAQIKQNRKVEKVKHGKSIPQTTKPQNPKADALKNKILVEF